MSEINKSELFCGLGELTKEAHAQIIEQLLLGVTVTIPFIVYPPISINYTSYPKVNTVIISEIKGFEEMHQDIENIRKQYKQQ